MVQVRRDEAWQRRGFTLLWNVDALFSFVTLAEVVSIREFFDMAKNWPEELPSYNGDALIVAGLEGCLDVLDEDDAAEWLETDLKEVVLSFQDEYQGQASLIFWLPSGTDRITMNGATEEYFWKSGAVHKSPLGIPLGRLLWAGAEREVERLLDTQADSSDYDGSAWIGLHHPRIS